MEQLRGYLAASEAENATLREALAAAGHLHDHDLANMRASHVTSNLAAVASKQEITKGRADLLESAIALALSRKETDDSHVDLVASELVNSTLSLSNAMLVASEATLARLVEERTAALTREIEERRRAEELLPCIGCGPTVASSAGASRRRCPRPRREQRSFSFRLTRADAASFPWGRRARRSR